MSFDVGKIKVFSVLFEATVSFYSLFLVFFFFSFCVNLSPILYHDYTLRLNNCFWTVCIAATQTLMMLCFTPESLPSRALYLCFAFFLSFVWIEKYTIYLCCFQCGCILRELVGFAVSKRARVCLCVRVRTHYLCTILPQSHIHVRITLQYIHTPVDTSCCL